MEETRAESGESTRLTEGWKLKEQKRQMKRIRWLCGKEWNQGKADQRKRNCEVNANRNSNKAKRRWYRNRFGGLQPSAELEDCVEQDPGSMGRAVPSSASDAPPSPMWIWVKLMSTRNSCKEYAEHSGGHLIAGEGTARSPQEPHPTPWGCWGRILATFSMQNSTQLPLPKQSPTTSVAD